VEKNTFATSAYIATSPEQAFRFLRDLETLNQWTLSSRMLQKIDDDTWQGSASGYHTGLYYHVRDLENSPFLGIEWQCGREYRQYFHVYPVFLIPPHYPDPAGDEAGVYFHWLSFTDPMRRTPMIMEGMQTVHTSECRALKAVLERQAGHEGPVAGRFELRTRTIFVDAPPALGVEYLSDLRTIAEWSHLFRPTGELRPDGGSFLDAYNRSLRIELRHWRMHAYSLIELDIHYPQFNYVQRCPMVVIPCAYAFGNPQATGFLLHRLTFGRVGETPRYGQLCLEDCGAECMNIKRRLEARAGNLEAFGRGWSYVANQ
jgi:hypothetical protein